jgi:carotenoid cleavage dioxygenase-like enzyme
MFCRMIHGVNIKDGKATYVARFVRTARLQQEESYGAAKFMKVWKLVTRTALLCIKMS